MASVEEEAGKARALLGKKIKEQGFTQIQVQELLGWGGGHISLLVHGQKALRFEKILAILGVIDVTPAAFFAELYRIPLAPEPLPEGEAKQLAQSITHEFDGQAIIQAVLQLLQQHRVLQHTELIAALKEQTI